jgi:hypothetical protein
VLAGYRILLSQGTAAAALIAFAVLLAILRTVSMRKMENRLPQPQSHQTQPWSHILWLLGPCSLGYFGLLLWRGLSRPVWDRYFLGLIPITVVCLLKVYQDRARGRISAIAIAFLVLLGYFGVARAYGIHARDRAILQAANLLRSSGVPRTAMTGGLEYDADTQLDIAGHVNGPNVKVPPGAYQPYVQPAWYPPGVANMALTPVVVPRYFIIDSPNSALVPVPLPAIEYTVILPPFHRWIYIQQLPDRK